MELFKEQGLLLVDSGNRQLRQLEKKGLPNKLIMLLILRLLWKINKLSLLNMDLQERLSYHQKAANLFYYDEEHFERVLLEFNNETKTFIGKDGIISFSQEELLAIANEQPEKLSNNVVTRPLMQETLFPTLAFIAGPGKSPIGQS